MQTDVELRLAVRQLPDGVTVPHFLEERLGHGVVRSYQARGLLSCPSAQWTVLSSLNPAQRDAVLHTDGPLLILAGAGSGKTRVITARIGHLISQRLAAPGEILAVTFTNKAAEEMRTRVEHILGEDCREAWISTFHSLCARLLRREAPAIGLSRDFVIYDSSDQLSVVKQAMKSLGIDDKMLQPRAALSRISQAKNRMESPEALKSAGWSLRDEQVSRIYAVYTRTLADAGALDFDDLLLKTVDLFETVERVRTFYARKFRFVLVDEYQDTNRPQYLLIRRLAEIHRNLCVVGDPDQSIYRWRGADLRNILDFEHDFPDVSHRQARTELPVHAGHSGCRVGRHPAESQSQGQAPLDRSAGRRAHRLLPGRRRNRGSRLHHEGDSRGRAAPARCDDRGPVPHECAVARD